MIKVCMITPNLLPVPAVKGGAIENLVTNIIKEQEQQKKLDLTIVSIYDEKASTESKKYKNTKFIYIKRDINYIFIAMLFNLLNKILKTNFNTYNHVVLNKIKKNKYDFVIAEGGHYESFNEFLKYFKKDQMILHLHHQGTSNNIINNTFSKLIAVSDFVNNDFKKTAKNINGKTLLNGVDTKNFEQSVSDQEISNLRKQYKLEPEDFVILFCGRLIEVKGVLELVQAVKKIDNPKIKLLILGSSSFDGGEKNNYIKCLEKETNEKKDRFIFTGYVNNWEIYKYYALADIMCMPSLWEEAAGLTAIESMLLGKVVLATDSGGVKEYLDLDNCIVVDKKNIVENLRQQILMLYKNKNQLKNSSKMLRLHANKFNTKNFYINFIKILEDFKEDDLNEKK